ncbi:MAG TPA: thioredoxin domain-containing protein [Polyangiaceae bacterium]|jgi:thioredoxin 1/putative thioredoxin|nr:thioredoxin domain-containing protein [Polyangiaceae bacterium]
MPVGTVNDNTFEQEILQSELPVLVEFSAEWCGPCKTVAPELAALSDELAGKAKVVTIDVDRSPVIARELGVQSVPTFVVFHQGRPAGGRVGALRRPQLREMIEPFLPRAAGALRAPELVELLKRRQVVPVDTRDAGAFRRAHLPSAVSIPLEELPGRLSELDALPGAPVLYCRSGDKTKETAEKLAREGTPVAFLDGGLLGWESLGLELERPD